MTRGTGKVAAPAALAMVDKQNKSTHIDLIYLVRALVKFNASDLHLKAMSPPLYRINGKLAPAKMDALTPDQVKEIVHGALTSKQLADLEKNLQVDLAIGVNDSGRFRCNVYYQRGTLAVAVRRIPFNVPAIEDLGIPSVVTELCMRPRGLLLVTGPTGSGKSTTLAAMVRHINELRHAHILTIEDPMEYVHRDIKCAITQREVGIDTHSIQDGLHAGLRQDPDIVMIGEMRDYETMRVAITAAETGRLVMSTLHTIDAKSTVERIMAVFPQDAQNQIRIQLATTLVGVISQQLVMRADGESRIPACEVMVKSPAIEKYIMDNELDRLGDAIATSNTYYRMQTMNQSLEELVRCGMVLSEDAVKVSQYPEELKMRLSGIVRE